MKILSLLLVLFTSGTLIGQETPLSGLYFSSHEVIKDKRTSLNLNPGGSFNLSRGFTLEFDAKFRKGDGHYGYIFRLIGDQKNNIDFVSNLASDSINFWLILKDTTLISYQWKDIPNGEFNQWLKVKFRIDPQNARLSFSLNNYEKVMMFDDLPDLSDLNIIFGACNYASFLNANVSPMTLNDIRLYDDQQRLFRHWKLSKHGSKNVYDEIDNAPAAVLNPSWLIDRHIQWNHTEKIQFNNLLGVTQNDATGQVFFVEDKAVYIYDANSRKLDTLKYLGGAPFYCKNNQVLYNSHTDELWSYDFNKNYINKFNIVTRKWSHSGEDCVEPDFWHHTKFISPLDSSLITFGGYGHYKYKSLLNRFNHRKETWEKLGVGEQIPPRYLSSLGLLDRSRILIFGGYGSKSGRQELSPQFYHDLYTINLGDMSVDSHWSIENTSGLVPCYNLIFDPALGKFVTLLYNSSHFETSLRLASFVLNTPEKHILADSIPYKFLDTKSWCNLFLNRENSELLAITVHDSELNLYSLAYPPLLPEEVYQSEVSANGLSKFWTFIFYLLLFAVIFIVFLRYRRSRTAVVTEVNPFNYNPVVLGSLQHKQKISSIYLFGGLQVFDKSGNDITPHFTPTLKELFLLIFLHSLINGKGVSSQMLNETLWFDKPGESARNNRNVNISKLRSLLDEIGNIGLSKESTFWKISFNQDVYCDYIEILYLLEKQNLPSGLQEDEIHRLLVIAGSGRLLPDIQNEWVDAYKGDFSNLLIDTLTSVSKQIGNDKSKLNLSYRIAECILKYDIVNEDAIAIKCSALYNLGKKGFAKQAYDSFCDEYKNLMETEFTIPFDELLKA
ncbi:hypothetical protein QQ020_00235 [Fulvivirgaceae bacterium BMA12]|uniref:DNA-binding transcriptional activator of the SARP family n=1 Tax=Agaribacillus aureus TaxID=3051825 RepID=A0ABT8KYC1_9BACT|nr:hypothetical protein [Fulvivirgaceae bacterium BMA12]